MYVLAPLQDKPDRINTDSQQDLGRRVEDRSRVRARERQPHPAPTEHHHTRAHTRGEEKRREAKVHERNERHCDEA